MCPIWRRVGQLPTEPVIDYATDINYACAVLASGELTCWGANVLWRQDGHEPPEGVKFSKISAGRQHACGLDTEGRAHCWGEDWESNPWPEPPDGTFVDIVTDHQITCVIDEERRAVCWWGWDRISERWLLPDARWRQIGLGEWDVCGTTPEGQAYCWGGHLRGRPMVCPTSTRCGEPGSEHPGDAELRQRQHDVELL